MDSRTNILITGATGALGRSLAGKLAGLGYDLVLSGRDRQELEGMKKELGAKGVMVQLLVMDFSLPEKITGTMSSHAEVLNSVSSVIHCTVSAEKFKNFEKVSPRTIIEGLNVNIVSTMVFINLMVSYLRQKEVSRILFIGSVAGAQSTPNKAIHNVSKGALNNLVESLAIDLAKTGISVGQVVPTTISEGVSRKRFAKEDYFDKMYDSTNLLHTEDVADSVIWALRAPEHVCIRKVVMYSKAQPYV